MARKKSETPITWHHVATRLTDAEREALESYRDRNGLGSLNAAIRHTLRSVKAAREIAAIIDPTAFDENVDPAWRMQFGETRQFLAYEKAAEIMKEKP